MLQQPIQWHVRMASASPRQGGSLSMVAAAVRRLRSYQRACVATISLPCLHRPRDSATLYSIVHASSVLPTALHLSLGSTLRRQCRGLIGVDASIINDFADFRHFRIY